MISIEDELPEPGREILVTRPIGTGPFKRRAHTMKPSPNHTSVGLYRLLKGDGYTRWMYVPEENE